MTLSAPFNLMKWIADNRELLRPPVGNQAIYHDGDFIVQIIGGPNVRTDYHVDPHQEFFYQLKGDIMLPVIDEGRRRDIPIRAGEVFMLPAFVPHSPQRPDPESLGMVIERVRAEGAIDAFEWYCEGCDKRLFRRELQLRDIVKDLPPVFAEYYGDIRHRTCRDCGHVNPDRG